jgi:DNA-binding response OmpR family regulator
MAERRTVLLVEDNIRLNESNRRALELKGYRVLTALTLCEAREHLKSGDPDVILLDVMLPDGDGIDFCGEIHGSVTSHILFLTAKTEQENLIKGLEYGGDDYITKPFKLEELLARVGAAMRRREKAQIPAKTLSFGNLTLDILASQASMDGISLLLQPKEFALLLLFAQNENKTMNADYLYSEVWKTPMNKDKNAIKTAIYRLRKKIEPAGYDIVMSRGKGYTFEKSR